MEKLILVIDDDPVQLDIMRCVLTDAGYKMMAAISGELGIKKAIEHTPDLIILDVIMPVLDGMETCSLLARHPVTQNIPVLFLTCRDDEAAIIQGFVSGGVGYCTKPCDHDDLLNRVSRLIHPSPSRLDADRLQRQLASALSRLSSSRLVLRPVVLT